MSDLSGQNHDRRRCEPRRTDGVQRALGREPRDFADYARNAAATGVWDSVTVAA